MNGKWRLNVDKQMKNITGTHPLKASLRKTSCLSIEDFTEKQGNFDQTTLQVPDTDCHQYMNTSNVSCMTWIAYDSTGRISALDDNESVTQNSCPKAA
jgi:hypothetical protein